MVANAIASAGSTNGPRGGRCHRQHFEVIAAGQVIKRHQGSRIVWLLPSGRYRASYLAPDGKRRAGGSTFATVADADAGLDTDIDPDRFG
jgi:hypothetical protein